MEKYKDKYNNWKLVCIMMKTLNLTLVSTEDEYDKQDCIPSKKKVSFYRNDDIDKKIKQNIRLDHIKQGESRGLTSKSKNSYIDNVDNWKSVYKMMNILNFTLISNEDEYNSQDCIPSLKKVVFYRNDDPDKRIFNIKIARIKSCDYKYINKLELKETYKKQSDTMKLKNPKGLCITNNLELSRINILFTLIKSFKIEHLLECRLMDVGIKFLSEEDIFYAGCQIKTGIIGIKGQVNFNTTYNKILNYIKNGESIIFICVNEDESLNTIWFLDFRYKDELEKIIVDTNCGQIIFTITPDVKFITNKKHLLFMNNFKYKITEIERLENEIKMWYSKARKLSLNYWNHNNEQILNPSHRFENASNLKLKKILKKYNIGIEFKNYEQIDIVIDGCNIQNKIISNKNTFVMRKFPLNSSRGEKIIYNINNIDCFICFKPVSYDTNEMVKKENYKDIYVIPTRKNSKANIDINTNNFSFVKHKKLKREIEYFNLDQTEHQINFIEYLKKIKHRKKVI